MKTKIPLLILCMGITSLTQAQNKYQLFVESKNIKWATQLEDSFHFSNPNLSVLLREQFINNKIKVALVEEFGNTRNVRFEDLPQVLQRMRPNEPIDPADFRDSLFSANAFDSRTNDLVSIHEILYVEKGMLKSYSYDVSPKYTVQTSWGMVLGVSNLFTTAFNTKRKISKSVKNKAIPIGNSIKKYVLADEIGKPLKQLYSKNLLDALWPYLESKNFEILTADSSKKLEIKDAAIKLIKVPIYDINGNLNSYASPVLGPESFHTLDIEQEWFYNKSRNIIYSKIKHLILYIKTGSGMEEIPQLLPLIKIVVK